MNNSNAEGRAKFQYAPFSINSGAIGNSGENVTLTGSGGVPVSVEKYIIPALSANSSVYGVCNDYKASLPNAQYEARSNPFIMNLADDNHIPAGAAVTFTLAAPPAAWSDPGGGVTYWNGCQGAQITYTYIDDTTEVILDENKTGNFANWGGSTARSVQITLRAPGKEVKAVQVQYYYIPGGTARGVIWAYNLTLKAQYTISSSDTLICRPCTITAADSRVKTFDADSTLDCSNKADGNYYVMKSITDGSLSLASSLTVSKTAPLNPADGSLWLDASMYPLQLKQYDGAEWQMNNDLVYLGDITVSNGVITSISNNEFNEYGYLINYGSAYIPDYTSSITRAAGTSFAIEAPSLLEIITYFNASGSQTFAVTINGITWNLSTPAYTKLRTVFLVKKGDNVNVTYNTTNQTCTVVTYPLKGAD